MDDVYGVLARPQTLIVNCVNSVITEHDTGIQVCIMDHGGHMEYSEGELKKVQGHLYCHVYSGPAQA